MRCVAKLLVLSLNILFFASSCKIAGSLIKPASSFASKQLDELTVFNHGISAFVLYDLDKKKDIVNIEGDRLFLPASNTKLFTFYTSVNILGDSLPLAGFAIKNDTFYFRGTGNPLCLNPDFQNNGETIRFLKSQNKPLVFCDDNFFDNRFGSGWAWDDYLYDYQTEKNSFPLYGNKLTVRYKHDSIYMLPSNYFNVTVTQREKWYFREECSNDFYLGKYKDSTVLQIPFITNDSLLVNMLSGILETEVQIGDSATCNSLDFKTYKIAFPDSVYIRLLKNSDNFIAEQLMLMCAGQLTDSLRTKIAIDYALEHLFPEMKDKCRWVDGSGLSRYNLFSPHQIVRVLEKIYYKAGWERIKSLFPGIGEGTLQKTNSGILNSAVFAKTGSMSNNYNLSGFITTAKGHRYIFSIMNNHFLYGSKEVKKTIIEILQHIYLNY